MAESQNWGMDFMEDYRKELSPRRLKLHPLAAIGTVLEDMSENTN